MRSFARIFIACALAASASAAVADVAAHQSPLRYERKDINPDAGLWAGTQFYMTPVSDIWSTGIKEGDKIDMIVSRDVMLGDRVAIARGTPGLARVTYRTGRGAWGKSAKFEVEIYAVVLKGREFPVTGQFRFEGKGNSTAVWATSLLIGFVWAAPITGGSATMRTGDEFPVITGEIPLAYTIAPPSDSGR